jgi:hypothetical protein
MSFAIDKAIERCNDYIEVGADFPWAFFDLGKFYLFSGRPWMSLNAYMRAIMVSTAPFMIGTSLRSLLNVQHALGNLEGFDWAVDLLRIGRAAKFRDPDAVAEVMGISSPGKDRISPQVVIVAGSISGEFDENLDTFRDLLVEAFRDFRGTIISGGTYSGVCRIAGDVQEAYPDAVRTVGYVPENLPVDVSLDRRYRRLRTTPNSYFSPCEPLKYWADIIGSGIDPAEVKVLGIGGGSISEFEYRLGMSLGAKVGIIDGSEPGSQDSSRDPLRSEGRDFEILPRDPSVIASFVLS